MSSDQQPSQLSVAKLPREPFLVHSRRLFDGLIDLSDVPESAAILEVGCGPASVLPSWIDDRLPGASLIQVDALPQVIERAKRFRAGADVRQSRLDALSWLETASQDLIIGMSVFDQNTVDGLPAIGQELARVLKPGGSIVYIHNEELNLPAVAKSFLDQRNELLVPSPVWHPAGDIEYAIVAAAELEAWLKQAAPGPAALMKYLMDLYPYRYGRREALSSSGNQKSPQLGSWNPDFLDDVRGSVDHLRQTQVITSRDVPTHQLLRENVLNHVISDATGFDVSISGYFEGRADLPWKEMFAEHPGPACFIRGVSRYGYACSDSPGASNVLRSALVRTKRRRTGRLD